MVLAFLVFFLIACLFLTEMAKWHLTEWGLGSAERGKLSRDPYEMKALCYKDSELRHGLWRVRQFSGETSLVSGKRRICVGNDGVCGEGLPNGSRIEARQPTTYLHGT